MIDIINKLRQNVKIEEGNSVFENILSYVYLNEGISVKTLSRLVLLPVPLVSAIKNELIKSKVLIQKNGICFTEMGRTIMKNDFDYNGINIMQLKNILVNNVDLSAYNPFISELTELYSKRPSADVTIDQSKCTLSTSLNRALLCLKNGSLIGKQILCVGDDDLVSVALGFLLKVLYNGKPFKKTHIHVLDIDTRIISYITDVAELYNLPITCHNHNLRKKLPALLQNKFDSFFTDPPYTIDGLRLFMSRGISALKDEPGLMVFLSFGHKSPNFTLDMHNELNDMGLMICQIIPRFNSYEGAEIIGNTSQMFVIRTTHSTRQSIDFYYGAPIYTGELRKTMRSYKCLSCHLMYKVGEGCSFITIEQLKQNGCTGCGQKLFKLEERINK